MTVKHKGNQEYEGLAADTKPVNADTVAGAGFLETDTRKRWYNDGTNWVPQEMLQYKKYKITKNPGGTTFVIDIHGKVFQQNADTQIAVQAELDAMPLNRVYEFEWDAFVFDINNPILLPTMSGSQIKKVKMIGNGFVGARKPDGFATCLKPSATFPTNRYIFELNCAAGSNLTGQVEIEKMQASNLHNFANVNAGFIKLETPGANNGLQEFYVHDIFSDMMWRTIHLIGGIWWGRFDRILWETKHDDFRGDAVIILDNSTGHTAGLGNPVPKGNLFTNIFSNAWSGQFVNCIRINQGGYNTFRDVWVEGHAYSHSVIALDATTAPVGGVGDNLFENISTLDLVGAVGGGTKASIYLGGAMKVWDNVFRVVHTAPYPETVLLDGANVMRNDIEIDANWGGVARVTDTTADPTNTIRVFGGNVNTSGGDVPITLTGTTSRIIDTRRGAIRTGTSTQSGNGSTTVFSISHGCFFSPSLVTVSPYSVAASAPHYIGSTGTVITVHYTTAPPAGTNNLIWVWRAEVYR